MRRTLLLAGTSLLALLAPSVSEAVTTPPSLAGHERLESLVGPPLRFERRLLWKAPKRAELAKLALEVGGSERWLWDAAKGTPSRVWGAGVPVAPKDQEKHAAAVLARNLGALAPGSTAADFAQVSSVLHGKVRTIGFEQRAGGLRVEGGQVSFRFVNDRLVLIASEASPFARARGGALVGEDTARTEAEGALADLAWSRVASKVTGPFVLPLVGDARVFGHRTVLKVEVETKPIGRWSVWVDAMTGEPVARVQELRFATGNVQLNAPERWPGATRLDYPAQRASVTLDGVASQTDPLGIATWPSGVQTAAQISLTGPWLKVLNDAGAEAVMPFALDPDGTFTWNESATPTLDAQIVTFVHTQKGKERVQLIDPGLSFVGQQITATVNIADTCNAFSDGTDINFYASGGGCENTGRLADVVHHELGHSVHAHEIIFGVGNFDGSLSEGLADYLACTISEDSGMGRGFFFSAQPLRQINPANLEYQWPDDIDFDPHQTGLIIAGALWDLREGLIAKLGHDPGVALADALEIDAQRRAIDIPTMYPEILVADDDDGDLSNGTPNVCEIDAAFAPHGLKQVGAEVTQVGTAALSQAGYDVTATITGLFSQCPNQAIESATLEWRLRGNATVGGQIAMAPNGNELTATIPSQDPGTVVQYQVRVDLGTGGLIDFPKNVADPWYELFVGEVVPLYCTDFETDPDEEGWIHGLTVGNPNTEGNDDWQWGKPHYHPDSGDPPEAYSYTRVYGNDLGAGNFNGSYKPNIQNFTVSPTVDTQGYQTVRLQYRRWLNVEDGHFDQAKIYANDVEVWKNVDSDQGDASDVQHRDGEWRFHDVDLSAQVMNGTVAVKFEVTSDQGLQMGGWTIDDFCIVGYTPPLPPDPVCGNGVVEGDEACDEGAATDTCRADCTVPTCGDGTVDAGEACDDGNTLPGDGCAVDCTLETGTPLVPEGGNCGCAIPSSDPRAGALVAAALGALALRRRRRR